jgi:uncharacterized membrane protein YfcA
VTPLELAALAGAGLLAGTVNTLAGGGSLIGLPALILLGDLPAAVANGTNRVGVILQSAVSAWQFQRAGVMDARDAARLLPVTCLGSAAGAWLSTDLDDALFRKVIGVVMILMLAVVLARPRRWLISAPEAAWPPWAAQLLFLGVGFYGGFLQAGVGVFLLASLVLARGQDLVRANAAKALLVAGFTVPPMAIFLAEDLIAWAPGLALAAGSAAGGWLGSRMAVSWGPAFVRWVLVGVVTLSSLKLFGVI